MDKPNKAMVFADAIVGEVIDTVHTKSEAEPGNEKEKLEFYAEAFRYTFQLLARKLLVIYSKKDIEGFLDQALSIKLNPSNKSDSSH